MTVGSVEPLKKLYARWGDQVHFVEVVVRQAHPGPDAPSYRTLEEKLRDAARYQEEDGIPWVVLADEVEGTVHQVYGGMADPTYLIDADGRVAYYNMWTYAPSLHQAIGALVEQGGRGVVLSGVNPLPHMTPAVTAGWRGLRRGLPQSFLEMETAFPGTASATWLGWQLRPLLAPLTQRARPLPPAVKGALAIGGAALAVALFRRLARGRAREA